VRTIVIGAGLAGLSAACHLVGAGHDVVLLERDPLVGGRSNRLDLGGFRFDTGPVVMTMPELLDEAIRAAGASPESLLTMRRLDPAYRAVYHDGTELEISADMAVLRNRIEAGFGAGNAAGFDRFIAWLDELYRVEFEPFVNTNLDSPLDLLRRPVLAARLLRLGGLGSLDRAVSSFFTDDRLTKIFSFQALYAGVAPADARAVLAVITYMDTVRGVFYPEGGMHAIPRALQQAAEQGGVEVHTGVTVDAILRRSDGAVAGVRTADGERLHADAVVCTLDLPVAYDTLLPDVPAPRRLRRGAYSPSAVVWHVGAKGSPGPHVRHHNIHFGREWSQSFTALIEQGSLMPDPSRLVTVPSVSDPGAAPDGRTALYVLEPVPHTGSGIEWASEGPALRERLYEMLEAGGYPSEIEVEALVTPDDWESMGMHLGTPFALAHTFFQSGPFRPPNLERRVPGLVFAGSATTPGVGIPMVLISGRLAAERVAAYAHEVR
jgi:phytoene desaturase